MLRGVIGWLRPCLPLLPAMAGEMSGRRSRALRHRQAVLLQLLRRHPRRRPRLCRRLGRSAPSNSRARGPVRRAFLPANTLQVKGEAVCATREGPAVRAVLQSAARPSAQQLPRLGLRARLRLLRFQAQQSARADGRARLRAAGREAAGAAAFAQRRPNSFSRSSPGRSCTSSWRARKAFQLGP